ncbi:CRISPR system precrRNA processing endoribonuclease RAMP protein Cas6 [Methylomonas paludis]|uniref:CRISPR system precrRNA processing endoribonuclease RAMP protein Cas6 n=1 Tax=Methylomonas paludis TaxID=1173101 RepID=A0A975MQB5_9GAMM|nr:CRISPR system precrRNA processing endoribonuclease RAMP protein Cas6 [Methylomonas paludis]QWF71561.1 CRISPR system precrRNA processing endoribonuclease RAMP protein Cas6 [Methylomonas paludis]
MAKTNQPTIPLKIYRFYFDTGEKIHLPEYSGSAWRGAFGHALKRTVCVVRNTPCQQCLLKNACAYSYIFETPPPANTEKMRKYNATPHPVVLRLTQGSTKINDYYQLDTVLFGHGQRYFPYIIHALQTAGMNGIGGHRQIFKLVRIAEIGLDDQEKLVYERGELLAQSPASSPNVPAMPNRIEISFNSPIRIQQNSKNVADAGFTFAAFFGALLRRISLISYFHTDNPLDTDFAGLVVRAKTVQFSSQNLNWYDWTRYSSRQQTEMQMGGVIGTVELDLHDLEEFWPYLWLGQFTHVGKGTMMGMGAYTIKPTSLPAHESATKSLIMPT